MIIFKNYSAALRQSLLMGALAIFLGAVAHVALAIEYPYALAGSMSATLNVNLAHKTNFNNRLLGLNCNWPEKLYGFNGYNNPDAQRLITAFHPSALRFPHGVWANFYDWKVDGRRIYDGYKNDPYTKGNYLGAVKQHPDLCYGFPGFATLHSNLNFEVLFTWNICYDSPEKGVRRLRDQDAKGFDTKWIELGNENFWSSQCSLAVDTVDKFLAVTKAHAEALHAAKPGLKLSVPVAETNPDFSDKPQALRQLSHWNAVLQTNDYYDAVSLHVYIKSDKKAVPMVLDAKNGIIHQAQGVRQLFPGKPIWLSEWAVDGGNNAISVLGMADTYLGFFEHPELFEICSYFAMNEYCPLIQYDRARHIHTKTSYGAAYEVIRNIFENSELYESSLRSSFITKGVEAVSAQAVVKNGRVTIFAINKTTNSIPLRLNFNGVIYTNGFTHQALAFKNVNDFKTYGLTNNLLATIAPVNGGIQLPPLSLNQISGLAVASHGGLPATGGQ